MHALVFDSGKPKESLSPFDIGSELAYLDPQGDTLFSFHAKLGVFRLQERVELVLTFLEMHNQGLIFLVISDLYVDAAFSDVRKHGFYLFTDLSCVIHGLLHLNLPTFTVWCAWIGL
jgi:hypothetical protein